YTPTVQYGYDGVTLTGCTTTPPAQTDSYPIGTRTSMCDGSGAATWIHDQMGRVKEERRTIGAASGKFIKYTYSLDRSLDPLTRLPPDATTYTYNGAGQPITAKDVGASINYVTAATYAPPGELTAMTMGSATGFAGIVTTNVYNNRLQPILLSAGVTGQ